MCYRMPPLEAWGSGQCGLELKSRWGLDRVLGRSLVVGAVLECAGNRKYWDIRVFGKKMELK